MVRIDPGWEPQPHVWLVPAGLSVFFLGGAWLCDAAGRVIGGRPTHYFPMALVVFAALAVAAVVMFRRETARARRVAVLPMAPMVSVTAEAMNLPKALTASSTAYPMPDLTDVIDAEVLP